MIGAGVGSLAEKYGKTAVVIALFLLFGMGIRGLSRQPGQVVGLDHHHGVVGVAAYVAANELPYNRGYPLLGLAVGGGCLVHTLGDMITRAGCPVVWPVPIRGERWYEIGLPDAIALRAGGAVEKAVVVPVFIAIAVIGVVISIPGVTTLVSEFVSNLSSSI